MPFLQKKKKIVHYHPTFYQAIITESQMDFVNAILSGNPILKLKKLDGKIKKVINQIQNEKSLKKPKDTTTYIVLEIRLNTLRTLIGMILKRYSEYEEMIKASSEVTTKETSEKNNYIQ